MKKKQQNCVRLELWLRRSRQGETHNNPVIHPESWLLGCFNMEKTDVRVMRLVAGEYKYSSRRALPRFMERKGASFRVADTRL